MKKLLSALFLAMLAFAPAIAQQYPSPTYNNVTIQGNLTLPSKTASSIFAAPSGVDGVPSFRALVPADFGAQTANRILASPDGANGTPTFRAIVGPDLPYPSTSFLGGVLAVNPVASRWVNSIQTDGVPTLSQPAFSDLSGNFQRTTVNGSSALLGPDGLGFIPFGSFAGYNWGYTDVNTAHGSNANVGFTFAIDTVGSGVFGPATGDYAVMHSARKKLPLSTTADGEVDAAYYVTEQGIKGDTAGILGDVTKTKGGTVADTGAAIGSEWSARFVNTSGVTTAKVHSLTAFLEDQTGVSGGKGYGSYNESWVGENYAVYYGGNYLGEDATTGWRYLMIGASDRTAASQYFKIRGDKVTGSERRGDIIIGTAGAKKTIRVNAANSLAVLNEAETSQLLQVNENGSVDFPTDPAWASYTPTLSCGSGSLTSASATGHFKGLGKTVHVRIAVTITTLGTCATSLNATLPAAVAASSLFYGRSSVTPRMLMAASGGAGSSTIFATDYNNGFPFASGDTVILTGTFEKQ